MQTAHFFSNGPMFNLSFYYHSFLYWEKVTSYEKYNHKWKLYGKFQRFNAIDRSIKMLKNGWISKKFQLERKIVKHFPRVKQRVALKKLFSHSTTPSINQIKSYYASLTKILGVKKWCSTNVFSYTKEKNVGWKIWESFLAVLQEHIIFNFRLVEVHKMREVFWAKLCCKMSEIFC